MPNSIPPEMEEMFRRCKEKVMADGTSEESAYGICYASVVEGKSEAITEAAKHGFLMSIGDVMATRTISTATVKAAGEWELDVLAIPFGSRDSDGQWFDANTDIMEDHFSTPIPMYQHGVEQGAKNIQGKPVLLGRTVPGSLVKKSDGWHLRVILDKTKDLAKNVMDAARNGLAAVSSGSISHLARLDIGGKRIMYEKNRPGRIAVWPLAEISLWEKGNGNMQPANQFAVALPAMKAIYREAGLVFPDIGITDGTNGASEAEKARRAKIAAIQKNASDFLKKIE